jgi:hypothetical protein
LLLENAKDQAEVNPAGQKERDIYLSLEYKRKNQEDLAFSQFKHKA